MTAIKDGMNVLANGAVEDKPQMVGGEGLFIPA